jgi:mycothiol synthase
MTEHSQALYGEPAMGADELREWFDLPDFVAVVAERRDGLLVGYADLMALGERNRYWIDLRVPPGEHGESAADALLEAMEAAAAPGAEIKASAASVDDLAITSLQARGYEADRYSFRMQIALDGKLEPPSWPDGVALRPYVPGRDDEAIYEVQEETFADMSDYTSVSYETWRGLAFLGSHDPSLWFLAVDGDEIAGISLCRPEWEGDAELGWVSTLGVRRPWRRRGLGLALLLHSFAELQARGKRFAGLGVDGQSPTGALQLYERGGMHVARRFDHFAKTLPA